MSFMKKLFPLLMLLAICGVLAILTAITMHNNGLKIRAEIQQALDAACGSNRVLESEGSYNHDPIFSWSSPKASCHEDITDKHLVCECRIP
jgi:hypothetical protein